jgi:hypothetical protein
MEGEKIKGQSGSLYACTLVNVKCVDLTLSFSYRTDPFSFFFELSMVSPEFV